MHASFSNYLSVIQNPPFLIFIIHPIIHQNLFDFLVVHFIFLQDLLYAVKITATTVLIVQLILVILFLLLLI
jgi:hypothetical protein